MDIKAAVAAGMRPFDRLEKNMRCCVCGKEAEAAEVFCPCNCSPNERSMHAECYDKLLLKGQNMCAVCSDAVAVETRQKTVRAVVITFVLTNAVLAFQAAVAAVIVLCSGATAGSALWLFFFLVAAGNAIMVLGGLGYFVFVRFFRKTEPAFSLAYGSEHLPEIIEDYDSDD